MKVDQRKAEAEEIVKLLRRALEGLEAIESTEAPEGKYDDDYEKIQWAVSSTSHALGLVTRVFDISEETR